jgi:hypothetical protein
METKKAKKKSVTIKGDLKLHQIDVSRVTFRINGKMPEGLLESGKVTIDKAVLPTLNNLQGEISIKITGD